MKSILNIGAGKIKPLYIENITEKYFLVQLDPMYNSFISMRQAEEYHNLWKHRTKETNEVVKVDEEAMDFLGSYCYQFDHIACYRYLEHVTKPEIQSFLYLMSTALKVGGTLDIIVPNYEILADMILNEKIDEDTKHVEWERHDTLLTYELLNEPSMPHASIWTPQRIKYFFELEGRFKVDFLNETYEFDGRSCYIRAILKRVK